MKSANPIRMSGGRWMDGNNEVIATFFMMYLEMYLAMIVLLDAVIHFLLA